MEQDTQGIEHQIPPELLSLPLNWHDTFNAEVWKGKASFHNRYHVEAVEAANETYLKQAELRDPLDLKGNLERWNKTHPQASLTWDELKTTLQWAIRCHDLGNIMGSLRKGETGELSPIFLDTYRANQSEQRSQRLAQILMTESNLPQEQKQKLIPLVHHLIGETVYQPKDRAVPFAIYIRVMDQIGNGLFCRDPQREKGLLLEMSNEKPTATISPYAFYNFTRDRLTNLLPNRKKWKELFRIWKKPLPVEQAAYPKEPRLISDLLATENK